MKKRTCLTLFATILSLGVTSLNQVEAVSQPKLTIKTDLVSKEVATEQQEENPTERVASLRAGWDLKDFDNLYKAPFFKDLTDISAPLSAEYAFSMSMGKRSEFKGEDLAIHGDYLDHVEISRMPKGSHFFVTNVGTWQSRSIDLKVTVNDYNTGTNNKERTLNLMFTDDYFNGINILSNQPTDSDVFIDLTFETVDSISGELVKVSGILPYNNFGTSNMISLSRNSVKEIYGHPTASVVVYRESDVLDGIDLVGNISTGGIGGTSATPGPFDPERQAGVVYKNMSTRRLYVTSAEGRSGLTMDPRSQVPIAPPVPTVVGNEYAKEPKMQYDISQFIPLEPKTHIFKDFFIDLPMDKVLNPVDLDKIIVTNDRELELERGTDFQVTTVPSGDGGEKLSIEILKSFRQDESTSGLAFYGRTIKVNVPVSIDPSADLSGYLSEDKKLVQVPLTSTTRIDDDFYGSLTAEKAGFAEATNQGTMTINHIDEQERPLIDEVEVTDVLGTPWQEDYTDNGGYRKDKIFFGETEVNEIAINGFKSQYKVTFIDERYDFNLAASSPSDSTGKTAKQDEEINYSLGIDSKAGISYVTPNKNNYKTVTVSLADYGKDLIEKISDAKLTLADGTVVASANYDETSKAYVFDDFSEKVSWDNDLELVFNTKTKADASIDGIVKMTPTIDLEFSDDALSFSGKAVSVETKIVEAALIFESHPTGIDFGTIKRATYGGVKRYPIQSMGNDLIIRDERPTGVGNEWTVSAKLKTDFTNNTDGVIHTLPGILKYVDKKNNRIKDMNKGKKVMIYNQFTAEEPLTNISKDWQANEEGLVLELFSGDAREGDYEATIQWELTNGL